MKVIKRKLLSALLALATCLSQHQVFATPVHELTFTLSRQKLSSSLIELSKQARMPIIFNAEIMGNKQAPALNKKTTVTKALEELLNDSGLYFSIVNKSFIVIALKPTNPEDSQKTLEAIYQPHMEQLHIYGNLLTGSRLARAGLGSSTPIDVLRQAELELRGSATIGETLKFLPSVSGNPTSTAVTNGGDGTATVTLRGLPASNTLVLINGRRVATDGLEGDAIDLNTISPAAIDRVEILKDGASAIYGTDAIAGVVNIVMKDYFEGFHIDAFYGETSRSDMETSNVNMLWGHNFDTGSALVSFTDFRQNGILSRDRTRSANADGRSWGGVDARSSITPAARIKLSPDQTVILNQDENGEYLSPNNPENFRTATNEDRYNYSAQTTAFVPHEHQSLYASLQRDINSQWGVFIESSVDKTHSKNRLAPTPFSSAFGPQPITVSATNTYNPFNVDITDIRRRLVELPARNQKNTSLARRITSGINGFHQRWSWDAYYSWSYTNAEETYSNLLDSNRLKTALGPDALCTGSCVPLNLFGAPGSITPEQINFISSTGKTKGYSKLSTWSLSTVGPLTTLPAGAVNFVAGVEYREEAVEKRPVLRQDQGPLVGANNFGTVKGSRSILDTYVETSLPFLGGKTLNKLTLELSARHSSYSDFGDVTNPKIGVLIRPNRDWLLRSTWSQGFRAPSLTELYKRSAESFTRLVDPCSNVENAASLPGCSQLTDANRNQYLTRFEGNKALQPERSVNNTIGVVWSPQIIQGFSSSLDFFKIKQKDVVDANAQDIVNQNAETGAFQELVIRDNNGEIQSIIARNFNVSRREITGVDISSRYQLPRQKLGRITFSFNASHIHSYTLQTTVDSPTRNIAGSFVDDATDGLGAIPRWKANMGVMWKTASWQGNYTIHFIDSLKEEVPGTDRSRKIESWTTHDIQAGYSFGEDKKTRLLAGIDNVFDIPPPRVASGFNDNLDARTHELKGRFMYVKLSREL